MKNKGQLSAEKNMIINGKMKMMRKQELTDVLWLREIFSR